MRKKINIGLCSPLKRSINTVIASDNTPMTVKVFEDIARHKKMIGIVYSFYRKVERTIIAPLMLMGYGIKSFLSISRPTNGYAKIVSIAVFGNEHRAIARIASYLDGLELTKLRYSIFAFFDWRGWCDLYLIVKRVPTLFRIARYCARSFHFVAACRAFSTVTCYLRYRQIFLRYPFKAILVASNYSPEATAAMAAAEMLGRKIIFTNHALLSPKANFHPPLRGDLAILTGASTLDSFNLSPSALPEVVYHGLEGENGNLILDSLLQPSLRIGIFLTALTNKHALSVLLEWIFATIKPEALLLRPHPNPLLHDAVFLQQLSRDFPLLEVSFGRSQSQDVQACNLVICGNSSVAIEVLHAGVPVVYDRYVDYIGEDYMEYVSSGLLPELRPLDLFSLSNLITFYMRPEWKKIMQYYDACYQDKELQENIKKNVSAAIKMLIE